MTRLAYLLAIDRATRANFPHFAQALILLYKRDFPGVMLRPATCNG